MKKILICTFIGLFGLLAAANVLMNRQTKHLSDITLTVYQAQAGDGEGGGEGGGDSDQWRYPLVWVEQYCGMSPDRWNDQCKHSGFGRESCEGYADGYTTPCT